MVAEVEGFAEFVEVRQRALQRTGSDVTIAFTPDGKTAYAATGGKVIPIITATNTPGKPIRTGGGPPGAISITP